jgi:uncharacterized protein
MTRPRLRRIIRTNPKVFFYKPQGIPLRNLEVIELSLEEFEALNLNNVKNLKQVESAIEMNTSQSTFQRILKSANQKLSTALVKGMAIKINKK